MTTRKANTQWNGSLMEGAGQVTLSSSGLGTYDVSWPARAEEPNGKTSPEELIAAAHSSCFSMALSSEIGKAGGTPQALDITADVTLGQADGAPAITGIALTDAGRALRDEAGAISEEIICALDLDREEFADLKTKLNLITERVTTA